MKRGEVGRVWSGLLALLYPPKCVCCGTLLESGEGWVCPGCETALPVTDESNCAQSGNWFRLCVSPFFLEGTVNNSLNRFKFHHQEANGSYFGSQMGECARSRLTGTFDVITWVPVSRKRRRERGFDQSQVLAERVAKAYGQKLVCTLEKVRNIPPLSQTKGGREVRTELVKGLYRTLPACHLAGKRVLLIDDIITTGSTLNEAGRVLLQAGAAEVCCVTAARSWKEL